MIRVAALRRALCAVLALTAALPLGAAELLIRNARVHTVDSAGTLDGADVRVRDGRIVEVGRGLRADAAAQIVDADGRPLTPGLFGGATGLGIEEVSLEPATVDNAHTPNATSGAIADPRPEFDIRPAFNPASAVIGVNRVEGISYALIAPGAMPGGSIFAGVGAVARLDGRPDAFYRGTAALLIDLGSDTVALAGNSRAAQYMLLDQAIREARPGKGMRDSDFRLLTPAGREVLARHLAGGLIAFNVDRAADIRQVLALAARTGSRALIVGGAEAWQQASALAAAGVPVLLDGLRNLPATFDQLGATLENAARLQAAGVRIGFTQLGDATHNARKVRQAAGNAVAHGLAWEAALAALTRNPAEMFGLGESLGRIAPGQQADLVLWSGDPLEVTSVVEAMWIEGRAQSLRSRQTELRDRYRPAAP